MIKLGDKVKDKVTGFKGIATSKTEYLNGCIRVGVTPKVDKEGKYVDEKYFDEPQLESLEKKKVKVKSKRTGGYHPDPQR